VIFSISITVLLHLEHSYANRVVSYSQESIPLPFTFWMWKRTRTLGRSQIISSLRIIWLQCVVGVTSDLLSMAARLIHVSCPSLLRSEIGGDTSAYSVSPMIFLDYGIAKPHFMLKIASNSCLRALHTTRGRSEQADADSMERKWSHHNIPHNQHYRWGPGD
jgi:hypothetical protein